MKLSSGLSTVVHSKELFEKYAFDRMLDFERVHPGSSYTSSIAALDVDVLLGKKLNRQHVENFLSQMCKQYDRSTIAVVKAALNMCGHGVISLGVSKDDFVELSKGFVLPLSPGSSYVGSRSDNVRTMLVDGQIENISELELLLFQLVEKNETAIVFARDFHPSVIEVLHQNFVSSRVKCIPIVVPYDVDHMNTLLDIAVIAGCSVLSSLRGDLVSCSGVDRCGTLRTVKFKRATTIIEACEQFSSSVSSHRRDIAARLSSADDAHVKLMSDRLRFLSDRVVNICVKDDGFSLLRLSQIDSALRWFFSCVARGIVELSDGSLHPVSSIAAAQKYFSSELPKLGAIIALEEHE